MESAFKVVAKAQNRAIMKNLPNLLSFFRIISIPFVVVCLFSPTPLASFLAALLFSIASLTDVLDGYIARQQLGKSQNGFSDRLHNRFNAAL